MQSNFEQNRDTVVDSTDTHYFTYSEEHRDS